MKYNGRDVIASGYPEDKHHEHNILMEFAWKVIDVCNYKCSYCGEGYGNDFSRPLSNFFKSRDTNQSWKSVLSKLRLIRNQKFHVSLLGGEPTLHPNINEIITKLNDMTNCEEIYLITNLSKSFAFFEKINELNVDKFTLNPSIHFDYYKQSVVDKMIKMHHELDLCIQPTVMLHDDSKHWPMIIDFIQLCIELDLEYNPVMLEPAFGYEPEYHDDFYDTFSNYLKVGRGSKDHLYRVVTDDNVEHEVTVEDINKYDLKRFKGWKCTPKMWNIDVGGDIINACTREPMSLGGSNLSCRTTCPLDTCSCSVWWDFDKRCDE